MPIFEYSCLKCANSFEMLVMSSEDDITCPKCGSRELKKLLSVFGVNLGRSGITFSNTSSSCSSCSKKTCSSCK